jgi:redox-sensitive bicupin YhaK (pirin superfamily)
VHFLQIWIRPRENGSAPSYEEKCFSAAEKRGRLRLIASADRAEGSVLINQDARVYAGLFDGNEAATLPVNPDRRLYVHVARGKLNANGMGLGAGDALKVSQAKQLVLKNGHQAEVLVFDLPQSDF